jgi:hypothetical protein
MATNPYFSQGRKSEQLLYEDLIVESLKMYGQDVYYLPRELVNKDQIFVDDNVSRFSDAYKIEMYIENTEGFDGEGDLFTKFGVEIRDAATFIVARRRWNSVIAVNEEADNNPFFRPREGDVIYLPLSQSMFQISRVETESPFFQLKDLPVFKMRCELFEYNDEDFDTDIEEIDQVEKFSAYQYVMTFDSVVGEFVVNEIVNQTNGDYVMSGEVVKYDALNNKLYLAHVGADDGLFHTFTNSAEVLGLVSGAVATPTLIEELQNIDHGAQNDVFDIFESDFLDFTETNPFGDPS